MERKIAIMAVITGIAILGGTATAISSFMSSSSDDGGSSLQQGTSLSGYVSVIIYDPNGEVKRYMSGDNIITNIGENCIAEFIAGVDSNGGEDCNDTGGQTVGNTPYDVIAIGTGGSESEASVSLGATQIVSANTPNVGAITEASGSGGGTMSVITWLATFTATTSTTFSESGIFDTTANGANMLAHKSFDTDATLTSGDTVAVTWVIDVGPND